MPGQTDELISRLILEAGAVTENASPEFARAWPLEKGAQLERLAELVEVANTLTALASAASALHR